MVLPRKKTKASPGQQKKCAPSTLLDESPSLFFKTTTCAQQISAMHVCHQLRICLELCNKLAPAAAAAYMHTGMHQESSGGKTNYKTGGRLAACTLIIKMKCQGVHETVVVRSMQPTWLKPCFFLCLPLKPN